MENPVRSVKIRLRTDAHRNTEKRRLFVNRSSTDGNALSDQLLPKCQCFGFNLIAQSPPRTKSPGSAFASGVSNHPKISDALEARLKSPL